MGYWAVLWLAALVAPAQEASQDNRILVRLVAAERPDKLISDLESITPIEDPTSGSVTRQRPNATTPVLGDDATLWVRGASVDRTNTFERYYQGKYINRTSELAFDPAALAVGEHVIEPGHHVFRLEKDGTLTSTDPDIVINGKVVALKTYRVDVFSVDGDKAGPPDTRMLGRPVGVWSIPAGLTLSNEVADLSKVATNLLSHARNFYPLRVYLPANTVGSGYLLSPCIQPFQLIPGGKVTFQEPKVSGLVCDGTRIMIPYLTISAWVNSKTGLSAGLGGIRLPETRTTPARVRIFPTRGDPLFKAGVEGLSMRFGLSLSGNYERYPVKFVVADNTANALAVRLMTLETGGCVFERGVPSTVRLQYKANALALTPADLRKPEALLEALRASTNAPDKASTPLMNVVRRVCKYALTTTDARQAERLMAVLAQSTTDKAKLAEGLVPVLGTLNEWLYERAFLDAKELAALPSDDALRREVARLATLDETQLLRLNRRLLELIFPDVFAPPPAGDGRPKVRMAYSPYDPAHEATRSWTVFETQSWEGDTLTFQAPDVPYGFYVFRVMLGGPEEQGTVSSLMAEFTGCVIEPKQDGTVSFVSNKGRNAFTPGETIRLQTVVRSRNPRAAGERTFLLRHPDGREDRLVFPDAGGKWSSQTVTIPATITRRLLPGRYELTVANLPAGLACFPFRFEMAAPRESLYRMIQSSGTAGTWFLKALESYDIDRGIATFAELGYNRFDYWTYSADHHGRAADSRAVLADTDERLMLPEAIYLPSARDQMLNACVRQGLEFADVLHTAGDNQIPRYIDGYINAGERWMRREVTSMRHSPAFDGMYMYQEAYESGLVGVPARHDTFFPAWRMRRAAEIFTNVTPSQIRKEMSRNVENARVAPANWKPQSLDRFLELRKWEMHGWGDFNTRLAAAGRDLLPRARMSTYHKPFLFVQNGYGAVMSATDFDCGYHPDVFENLDIAASEHYHDGPTLGFWPHSPIMIALQRESPVGGKRLVWANIGMHQESSTLNDGQLQRQMAFAMLQEGADGISQYWVPVSFTEGPNPDTVKAKETTRLLNKEILAPFGELVTRCQPGYLKVGIVNTLAQLSLSEFKNIRTANQLEELWVACWRMGYPAVFLREPELAKAIEGYQVIFVPGIRFKGELPARAVENLQKAIAAGCKVVVERDSTLDAELPGVIKLKDFDLMNYYLGAGYNPAAADDELERIFSKSQRAVDYLRPRMAEWAEPTARGPFKVGPNWRSSGGIHYLLMSNYDDPDYEQTCKDSMAKPVRMPLTVAAYRGAVAYDLLARAELPLGPAGTNQQERSLVLDMTRCQGAMVAFLPEKIAALQLSVRRDAARTSMLLNGSLMGASGKAVTGAFPTRIRLLDGKGQSLYAMYRVLGSTVEDLTVAIPLTAAGCVLEVTENISGKSARIPLEGGAATDKVLCLENSTVPYVPYPSELQRFLTANTNALLVLGRGMEGVSKDVERLVAGLGAKGLKVSVVPEGSVWHVPTGDPTITADPTADGFHYWSGGTGIIAPRVAVDHPLIILSPASGSFLLNSLAEKGFLTELPTASAGLAVPPTIQVASRAFHWKYDTLCVVANDGDSVRRAVDRLLEQSPAATTANASTTEKAQAAISYGAPEKVDGRESLARPSAMSFLGNNEYILDMKFDAAGNIYLITWGHGDNLYSLDPAGKLRFSRRLPEMGASRLDVDSDRVVVFTAYGSRLYQVALDGKPISQACLTMDPGINERGTTYRERATPDLLRHGLAAPEMNLFTELFRYAYLPGKRRVVYYDFLTESMRVLDGDLRLVAEWQGELRISDDGRATRRRMGEFVCSPDGTKVAQMEGNALVLRDLNDAKGRKLSERPMLDLGGSLSWGAGEPGPTMARTHYGADLAPLRQDPPEVTGAMFDLGALGVLVPDGATALRLMRASSTGEVEVARFGTFTHLPTFAQASPDGKHLVFLDEYWMAYVHEVATGKRVGQAKLSEMGFALSFMPDSQKFLVGGLRGAVMCYALDGTLQWSTVLGPFNRSLAQTDFPRLDPAFVDSTEKLFRPLVDEPGELDALVTMDRSRLINGDCEAKGGWQVDTNEAAQAGGVTYADVGHQGRRSLKIGATPVQQQIEGLIGEHFTWVLEFYHRSASPDKPAQLLAGMDVTNRHPDNVVRTLPSGKEWRFDRVVFKSGGDPKSIQVGFQALGGEVLVDDVTLRRIRFPSVNHMLHPPVYDVEPVILHNPLFQRDYDPLGGTLREQIPNIVLAQRTEQIANALLTDSFLQNGRLNDVSSDWDNAPLGTRDTKVALGLKVPRWISMVAVYFNAYDEENTTRHFDIYVSDVNQRKNVRVASVRNNRSLFRLVKFPPCRADQVQVMLVNTVPRQQTLTEVEIYGPMSGSDQIGIVDAEGQNTYMGSFARVDKRAMPVAAMYEAKAMTAEADKKLQPDKVLPRWSVPVSQVLIGEQNVYLSRSYGYNERIPLAEVGGYAATAYRTGGMGFGPCGTMYGGALLKPGSDGKLYCIDPESGRAFWSVLLGERLTGCPVAIGLDVYLATDTGRLYTLDLASGAILGETKLSGPVFGSVATDNQNLYVITASGRLQALPVTGGREAWSVEIARLSDSTPAVDGGVVYLADQKGTARAVRCADGKVLWTQELGSEFCRCPVVLPDQVVFGCSDGKLTALNRSSGARLWQNQQKTRFIRYDPVPLQLASSTPGSTNATGPLQSVLLCMSGRSPQLLDLATGNPAARQLTMGSIKNGKLTPSGGQPGIGDLMAPISYYNGSLAFVTIPHEDRVDAPIYNDTAYHWFMYGTAQMLKALSEPESKEAQDARRIKPVARLEKTVEVDGLLDDWGLSTNTLSGPDGIFPVKSRNKGGMDGKKVWIGFDDLGSKVYLASDDTSLYLAVKVTDDVHMNAKTEDQIVEGDSLQIGCVSPAGVASTLALALTQDGPVIRQLEGGKGSKLAQSANFAILRAEEDQQWKTCYEVRLPLAELGLKAGAEFGLNLAVMDDDDGKGVQYWLQMAPGLAGRDAKTEPPAKLYPRFVLPK